jgi:hypothetical protein
MTLNQGTMHRNIAALLRRHPRLSHRRVPNEVRLYHSSSCQWPFINCLLVTYVAKRAETRECPICRESIPLRLLGQHYTLENSRVQAILDHIGDLEGFSDPHASDHVPYVNYLYTHPSLGSTPSFRGVYAHAVVHKVHAATPRRATPP